MKPDDPTPPISFSRNKSVILRIDRATQKGALRWLAHLLTAGVGIGVYQAIKYLIER